MSPPRCRIPFHYFIGDITQNARRWDTTPRFAPYWEGAVSLEGRSAGKRVTGAGYVELTGYAGSLGNIF